MDYKILWSKNLSELQDKVILHMENGYIPAGGIYIIGTNSRNIEYYYQSVYKLN